LCTARFTIRRIAEASRPTNFPDTRASTSPANSSDKTEVGSDTFDALYKSISPRAKAPSAAGSRSTKSRASETSFRTAFSDTANASANSDATSAASPRDAEYAANS